LKSHTYRPTDRRVQLFFEEKNYKFDTLNGNHCFGDKKEEDTVTDRQEGQIFQDGLLRTIEIESCTK
jgi:hypothetical protein